MRKMTERTLRKWRREALLAIEVYSRPPHAQYTEEIVKLSERNLEMTQILLDQLLMSK